MKIVFLVCMLICTNSIAGFPNEDENVSQIVNELKKSAYPSIDDMNIGRKWHCDFFSASKGKFEQENIVMSFEEDGDYIHAVEWQRDRDILVPYVSDFGMMIFGKKGLVGNFSGQRVYNTFTLIRKLGNRLLVEQSGILLDRFAGDVYWGLLFRNSPVAILSPEKKALYYAKCRLNSSKNLDALKTAP